MHRLGHYVADSLEVGQAAGNLPLIAPRKNPSRVAGIAAFASEMLFFEIESCE